MKVVQDLELKGHDPKFKMAAMPKYGKNKLNDYFSRIHLANLADILQGAYGAPIYIK